MSDYGYCQRGGMNGICTSKYEMGELAEMLNTKFADEYVPLPGMDMIIQINIIKEHDIDDSSDNVSYWETETGSHGWCDKITGKVVQWG